MQTRMKQVFALRNSPFTSPLHAPQQHSHSVRSTEELTSASHQHCSSNRIKILPLYQNSAEQQAPVTYAGHNNAAELQIDNGDQSTLLNDKLLRFDPSLNSTIAITADVLQQNKGKLHNSCHQKQLIRIDTTINSNLLTTAISQPRCPLRASMRRLPEMNTTNACS